MLKIGDKKTAGMRYAAVTAKYNELKQQKVTVFIKDKELMGCAVHNIHGLRNLLHLILSEFHNEDVSSLCLLDDVVALSFFRIDAEKQVKNSLSNSKPFSMTPHYFCRQSLTGTQMSLI